MAELRKTPLVSFAAACAMFALCAPATAQQRAGDANTLDLGDWRFTVSGVGGVEHQFDADINGESEFDVTRLRFILGAGTDITDDLSLNLNVGYQYADYSFSGETGFASVDPWDDVHTIAFGAIMSFDVDHDWSVFGGPIFSFSREDSADWGDSFVPAGVIGVRTQVHRSLSLGLGIGVMSPIEDNTTFFPVLSVDWQINDQLSLQSSTARETGSLPGLELVYDCGNGWEFAAGGTYEYHRFRLEDSGFAPDGVGEETSIPLWLRATYEAGPNFTISAMAGVKLGGELVVEDSDGDELADEDYDTAPFVGLFASYQF